jgi:hypothetical protein
MIRDLIQGTIEFVLISVFVIGVSGTIVGVWG